MRGALLFLALGCHQPAPQAPPLGAPGTMMVSFRSSLGWPYRIERAVFALDGVVVAPNQAVPAVPGAHFLAVRAELTLPCGALSTRRAKVTVRAMHALGMGTDAAGVRAELYERGDVSLPIDERIRVRFAFSGAREGVSHADPAYAECQSLSGVAHDVCSVDVGLRLARERRDIIDVHCKAEKQKSIAALLPLARAGDAIAIARIHTLAREAGECVGEDLAFYEESVATFEDTCGPMDGVDLSERATPR